MNFGLIRSSFEYLVINMLQWSLFPDVSTSGSLHFPLKLIVIWSMQLLCIVLRDSICVCYPKMSLSIRINNDNFPTFHYKEILCQNKRFHSHPVFWEKEVFKKGNSWQKQNWKGKMNLMKAFGSIKSIPTPPRWLVICGRKSNEKGQRKRKSKN